NTRDFAAFPLKSLSQPEMDSINNEGEVVYAPVDEKLIFNSGLFNIKTGEWAIPAKYEGVKEWEGIYGAFIWPDDNHEPKYKEGGMLYDFYKYDKKTGLNETP